MVVDLKATNASIEDMDEGDPLWSFERMARYMGVSVKQVRRWHEQGMLRVVRFGPKLLRIRRSAVESFIDSHAESDPREPEK